MVIFKNFDICQKFRYIIDIFDHFPVYKMAFCILTTHAYQNLVELGHFIDQKCRKLYRNFHDFGHFR